MTARILQQLKEEWYKALVVLVMIASGWLFSIWYTNQVDQKRMSDERENDREWCELITLYTDYYRANPPTTELGQKHAELMQRRHSTLDC